MAPTVPQPESEIDCIDCGGRAYRLSRPDEDGLFAPGDIIAYRCRDCWDRWDLLFDPEPEPPTDLDQL
jgi:DNA-directed RNA polymerase subunit RPC12/RpoP